MRRTSPAKAKALIKLKKNIPYINHDQKSLLYKIGKVIYFLKNILYYYSFLLHKQNFASYSAFAAKQTPIETYS
jgi:hypothetical protein